MKMKVSIPEDYPLSFRNLNGVGKLYRGGSPAEVDLSDAQVASLKSKGLKVTRVSSSKAESKPDKSDEQEV